MCQFFSDTVTYLDILRLLWLACWMVTELTHSQDRGCNRFVQCVWTAVQLVADSRAL